jgi:hypothetical protein
MIPQKINQRKIFVMKKKKQKKNQRFDENMTKHQKPEIQTQENIGN